MPKHVAVLDGVFSMQLIWLFGRSLLSQAVDDSQNSALVKVILAADKHGISVTSICRYLLKIRLRNCFFGCAFGGGGGQMIKCVATDPGRTLLVWICDVGCDEQDPGTHWCIVFLVRSIQGKARSFGYLIRFESVKWIEMGAALFWVTRIE
jgi:hypothetical protein